MLKQNPVGLPSGPFVWSLLGKIKKKGSSETINAPGKEKWFLKRNTNWEGRQ